jgi:hypothetical protein
MTRTASALLRTAAVALVFAAAAVPALAQPTPDAQRGPRGMEPPRMTAAACEERSAREAARLAYVERRLNLTAEQRPVFARFAEAARAADAARRQACVAAVPASAPTTPPTIVERSERTQRMMQSEAERLQAVRPSLAALYEALTPGQRQILDRPMGQGMRGGHGDHGHGDHGHGGHDRGDHGRGDHGPEHRNHR